MFLMTLSELNNFESKVNKTNSCWLWTGELSHNGYGRFKFFNSKYQAHRITWELYRGYIPKGLLVLHECDTPACVNPDHLFLGTNLDNTLDVIKKGRWGGGGPIRLSKEQREEVINLRKDMKLTYRAIAARYKVSHITILRTVRGYT